MLPQNFHSIYMKTANLLEHSWGIKKKIKQTYSPIYLKDFYEMTASLSKSIVQFPPNEFCFVCQILGQGIGRHNREHDCLSKRTFNQFAVTLYYNFITSFSSFAIIFPLNCVFTSFEHFAGLDNFYFNSTCTQTFHCFCHTTFLIQLNCRNGSILLA